MAFTELEWRERVTDALKLLYSQTRNGRRGPLVGRAPGLATAGGRLCGRSARAAARLPARARSGSAASGVEVWAPAGVARGARRCGGCSGD
jgi:hypothetical protein